MNLCVKQRIRDMSLVITKGEEGGREMGWEFETSRCKPVYSERINNKVL